MIGVSHGHIGKLNEFSVSEYRNKLAVASDANWCITKAYDAVLKGITNTPTGLPMLIAPTGKSIYEYPALDTITHVENTMSAVERWQANQKKD